MAHPDPVYDIKLQKVQLPDLKYVLPLRRTSISEKSGHVDFISTDDVHILKIQQNDILKEFKKPDSYFLFASAPPFENPSPIKITADQQLCGIASMYKNPENAHELVVSNLYTIQSPYPTGSILLQQMICIADQTQARCLRVQPYNQKAMRWYMNQAPFDISDDEDDYNNASSQLLFLFQENYPQALDKLWRKTGYTPELKL